MTGNGNQPCHASILSPSPSLYFLPQSEKENNASGRLCHFHKCVAVCFVQWALSERKKANKYNLVLLAIHKVLRSTVQQKHLKFSWFGIEYSESIEWFIEDHVSRAVVWFSSYPAVSPPLPTKLDWQHTGRLTQLADGRDREGTGKEPKHTMARKSGPL